MQYVDSKTIENIKFHEIPNHSEERCASCYNLRFGFCMLMICGGCLSLRVGVLGRAHTSSKPFENTVNTVQNFKNCSEN